MFLHKLVPDKSFQNHLHSLSNSTRDIKRLVEYIQSAVMTFTFYHQLPLWYVCEL